MFTCKLKGFKLFSQCLKERRKKGLEIIFLVPVNKELFISTELMNLIFLYIFFTIRRKTTQSDFKYGASKILYSL